MTELAVTSDAVRRRRIDMFLKQKFVPFSLRLSFAKHRTGSVRRSGHPNRNTTTGSGPHNRLRHSCSSS